jgi:hypothetical protein
MGYEATMEYDLTPLESDREIVSILRKVANKIEVPSKEEDDG